MPPLEDLRREQMPRLVDLRREDWPPCWDGLVVRRRVVFYVQSLQSTNRLAVIVSNRKLKKKRKLIFSERVGLLGPSSGRSDCSRQNTMASKFGYSLMYNISAAMGIIPPCVLLTNR